MADSNVKLIVDRCDFRDLASWQQVSDVFLSALLSFVPMRNGLP
jgi:hypothetical protein